MNLIVLRNSIENLMDEGSEIREKIESEIVYPLEIRKSKEILRKYNRELSNNEIEELIEYVSGESYSETEVMNIYSYKLRRVLSAKVTYELYLHLLFLLTVEYTLKKIADDFDPWGIESYVKMVIRVLYPNADLDTDLYGKIVVFLEDIFGLLSMYSFGELYEIYRRDAINLNNKKIEIRSDEIILRFIKLDPRRDKYFYRINDQYEKPVFPAEFLFGVVKELDAAKTITVVDEFISNFHLYAVTCLSNSNSFGRKQSILRFKTLRRVLKNKYFESSHYSFYFGSNLEKLEYALAKMVVRLLDIEEISIDADSPAIRDLFNMYAMNIEFYHTKKVKINNTPYVEHENALKYFTQQYDILNSLRDVWDNLNAVLSVIESCERGEYNFSLPEQNIKIAILLATVYDNCFQFHNFPIVTLCIISILAINDDVQDEKSLLDSMLLNLQIILKFLAEEYANAMCEIFDYLRNAAYIVEGVGECGFAEFVHYQRLLRNDENWESYYKREYKHCIWAIENLHRYHKDDITSLMKNIKIKIINRLMKILPNKNNVITDFNIKVFNDVIENQTSNFMNNFNN